MLGKFKNRIIYNETGMINEGIPAYKEKDLED